MFEGNRAETKTLVPVIEQFKTRHKVTELVVVADAGMLSATNLNALEDAGYRFIVGSRQSRVPTTWTTTSNGTGNQVPDDATIETSRQMGTGKDQRSRRVVYHYSFKRRQRERRTINAQVTKAEKVAAGKRPIARNRFVTVTTNADGKKAEVNWEIIKRARFCVTNIDTTVMDSGQIVAAYRDLWRIEESFRMTKSDLTARPIFHHKQEAIEAHLILPLPPLLAPGRGTDRIVLDNFSPHLSTKRDQRVGEWATGNNVELAYVPLYGSWLNRIDPQFTALRYFAHGRQTTPPTKSKPA